MAKVRITAPEQQPWPAFLQFPGAYRHLPNRREIVDTTVSH